MPIIPEMVSQHALDLYNELKKTDIFIDGNLNPSTKLIDCIANNIKNEQVKTTFTALKNTNNSLQPKYIASSVFAVGPRAYQDDALKLYFALGLYYAKFNAIDVAALPINKKDQKTEKEHAKDGHAH